MREEQPPEDVDAPIEWLLLINLTVASLADAVHPNEPCTAVLTTAEWQALYIRVHRTTTLPEAPLTTYQAVRWIAQLGGFLGRRGNGEPGIIGLWRDWVRLQDMAAT